MKIQQSKNKAAHYGNESIKYLKMRIEESLKKIRPKKDKITQGFSNFAPSVAGTVLESDGSTPTAFVSSESE